MEKKKKWKGGWGGESVREKASPSSPDEFFAVLWWGSEVAGSAGGGCCRGWRGSAQRNAPGRQHHGSGQLRTSRSAPGVGPVLPHAKCLALSGAARHSSRLSCIVSSRNRPSGVIIPIFFSPFSLSLLCRNDSLGTWSTQGCKTVLTDASHTKCLCDRLSTFAILAQQPREIVSNEGGKKARSNAKAIVRGERGGSEEGGGGLVELSSQVYFRHCIEELFNIPGRLMLLVSCCTQCLSETNSRFCDITKFWWNFHVLKLYVVVWFVFVFFFFFRKSLLIVMQMCWKLLYWTIINLTSFLKGCKPFQGNV